jgi:predicted unusual protein kinase regulating ubiquinone biosynthesis (AarF/ABC1/UbiB family)
MVSAFSLKGLDTRALVDELRMRMRDELDYRLEAANIDEFTRRFAGHPFVHLPVLVPEHSGAAVLTTEWVDGLSWNQFLAVATPEARQRAGEVVWRFAQHAIHRLGVFNGDPHPGNYLFTADGDVTFLDFGMVIDVPVDTRRALFETIIAAIRRDPAGTANGFFALGMVAPGTAPETMTALVDTLLDIAYSETATIERARVVADRVMRELFNWPIILPGELVYFARTAALIEGIGARYDRNFNSIRVASPVILRMRNELLAVLLGDNGTREPLVTFAATLGALAGSAYTVVKRFLPERLAARV